MSKGTPIRNVRVPDDIWAPAKERANQRGENLSDIIRKALIDYTLEPDDTRKTELVNTREF